MILSPSHLQPKRPRVLHSCGQIVQRFTSYREADQHHSQQRKQGSGHQQSDGPVTVAQVILVFRITELFVAQAHLVITAVVQHVARHEGLAGHQSRRFGHVLHCTQHPDVTLHDVRAQMSKAFELGLAVPVDRRLEVSTEASHAVVRSRDATRVLYRGAIRVTGAFFGFHWWSRRRRSLLIRISFPKSGQSRRANAEQHY